VTGQRPNGQFDEPSDLLLADKADFGTSRVRRWFNRDWRSY
jgi:sulfide:quinone oxidoreductase